MSETTETLRCRHCAIRKAIVGKRLLCWGCYNSPGVRDNYPSMAASTTRAARGEADTDRMSAAELDAFVADGLRSENRPGWWASSSPRGDILADVLCEAGVGRRKKRRKSRAKPRGERPPGAGCPGSRESGE